ncbi:hypothetical protein L7F22_052832 [Adiantum nelumboides]|nr:hypothetical protein [Adiantum nelumboides]
MTSKATAAGGAGVGPSRRKWDVEEYTQKARDRDREEKERIQENEERKRKGQMPLQRTKKREEIAKPTQELQARKDDLQLTKNQGKTLMVENEPGKRKGPGFYCELCNRTFKDSIAYLDHVNGRLHLRKLGQTTQVERSTLEEVRERLEYWIEEFQSRKTRSNEYDFEKRLAELAEQQKREKEERKQKRKLEKEARRGGAKKIEPISQEGEGDTDAMAMMGFASFGTSKKR